jgi:hypothetical protein
MLITNDPDNAEKMFVTPFLLGLAALGLCGIPFIPAIPVIVWPPVLISLFLVCRGILLGITRSGWCVVAISLTLGMDLVAAYLLITGKHLIKWLGL